MKHKIFSKNSQVEIASLFSSVFTSSEGEKEGKLIGDLVSKLALGIDNQDIICLGTHEDESIIGSIFFTRLCFDDPIQAFMLAPVAVRTEHQGKGIGQSLINFGLNELKNRSAFIVITYGDPSFYSKVGFSLLSEDIIQAPLKLSMPEGWLGQSITDDPIPTIKGRPTCVEEFNDPAYW